MTEKEKIYDLLQKNRLTSLEISEKLNIDEGIVRTNIARLIKENKIHKLTEKVDRYCLYAVAIDKEKKEVNDSDLEFKEGFKELVKFFDSVMKSVKAYGNNEIKTSLKDNLARMNYQLIDKLKAQVIKVE